MKKFFAIIFTLTMVFSLAACGQGGDYQNSNNKKHSSASIQEDAANTRAVKCLTKIMNSNDVEEVKLWLTEDSKDYAESLVEFYKDREVSVEVEYKTKYNGYDIFYYEARDLNSKEKVDSGYSLLYHNDRRYLLCVEKALQAEVREKFMCDLCNGGGSVGGTSEVVCGICGGTGMQYMPAVYYDAALQMWMGQNVACSGCGGAGRHPGASGSTCPDCNGQCIVFD